MATAQRISRRLAGKPAASETAPTLYLRPGDRIYLLYAQTCDSIHGISKI